MLQENKNNHCHDVFNFQRSSHNFNPQSFPNQSSVLYLKFHVSFIDLPQFDISIPYGIQIDNGIQQCVNSRLTEISKKKFVVHDQYIRFAAPFLFSIYQ